MKASEVNKICQKYGFKNTTHLGDVVNKNGITLTNWCANNPILFNVVCMGAVEMMKEKGEKLIDLDEFVTVDEILFLKNVIDRPNSCMGKTHAYSAVQAPIPLWPNLERLGAIKSIGRHRWKPTKRLRVKYYVVEAA